MSGGSVCHALARVVLHVLCASYCDALSCTVWLRTQEEVEGVIGLCGMAKVPTSSAVHSALEVGLDMGMMMGRGHWAAIVRTNSSVNTLSMGDRGTDS